MTKLELNRQDPLKAYIKHIQYVKEHIVGVQSKYNNIVEYLKIAAEDFIKKLERKYGL